MELVDGTTFALYLPAELGVDFTLEQDSGTEDLVEIRGGGVTLHIRLDFCRYENLSRNERGLLTTSPSLDESSDHEDLVFCRPDEFLTMRSTQPPGDFSVDDFHIVPISYGEEYVRFLQDGFLVHGQCCFEDRGPMWHDRDMIVANGNLSNQIMRLDGQTLVPEWTTDLRDAIGAGDEWVGDGAFLAAIDESGTVIATTGFGWVVGLDATTAERRWVLDLEGQTPIGISATSGGDWLVYADVTSEGSATAPELWRFSADEGQVTWRAKGIEGTDPQWDRPQTIGDLVVVADVPSYSENPTGAETAHVLAFDLTTGERRWAFDLASDTSAFSSIGTVFADAFRDDPLLLVSNVDGVLFRLDPATGTELWRNDSIPGLTPVSIVAGGPGEVTVQRGDRFVDLDLATGTALGEPRSTP
ncbi:MAG: PQQ-binding-like beta-propeller repeat protein [Acidimicrobiales bacterium]